MGWNLAPPAKSPVADRKPDYAILFKQFDVSTCNYATPCNSLSTCLDLSTHKGISCADSSLNTFQCIADYVYPDGSGSEYSGHCLGK